MSRDHGRDAGMSLIVKTMTRIVSIFIFLFGATVVLYGHVTPGGGFAGGVIIAASFVLIVLAFGKEYAGHFITGTKASVWDCGGALAFLGVALMGYLGGAFFWNFLRPFSANLPLFRIYSAGSVVLSNVAVGIKVGMGLLGVFLVLATFRPGEGSRHD